MEDYKMIVAGLIGSAVTLLLTALIEYFKEKRKEKRDRRIIVFQRKIDAAESAMSWFQESIDCFRLLQLSFNELEQTFNPVTFAKFDLAVNQSHKLYMESNNRLYSLYLYYDMSDIERKYDIAKSVQFINDALCTIGKYSQQAETILESVGDDNNVQVIEMRAKSIALIKETSKAIDDYIDSFEEMQCVLRNDIKRY